MKLIMSEREGDREAAREARSLFQKGHIGAANKMVPGFMQAEKAILQVTSPSSKACDNVRLLSAMFRGFRGVLSHSYFLLPCVINRLPSHLEIVKICSLLEFGLRNGNAANACMHIRVCNHCINIIPCDFASLSSFE